MLKKLNILIYASSAFLVFLYPEFSVDTYLLIFICLFVSWVVTHITISKYYDTPSSDMGLMVIFIMVFFWIAYVSKLPAIIYFPDAFWVIKKLIYEDDLRNNAAYGFFIATIGYSSLILSIQYFKSNIRISEEFTYFKPKLKSLLIFTSLFIILKYILKVSYNLGVVGSDPVYLGVPMLAGMLSLLIGTGGLLIVNLALFNAIYAVNRKAILWAFLLVVANVVIELKFGSKMTLMFEVVILTYYYYMLRRFSPLNKRYQIRSISNIIGAIVGSVSILLIVFYKFLNYYRFAMLSGADDGIDFSTAIKIALENEVAEGRSSIIEMYNRINGLELLTAVIKIKEDIVETFSLLQMFDGSLMNNFSEFIMGTDDSKTSFGLTQFGYLFLSGGYLGLILGSVFMGASIVWLQKYLLNTSVNNTIKIAMLPVWYLLVLKLLMGSGQIILWSKEVILFIIIFKFGSRIFFIEPSYKNRNFY